MTDYSQLTRAATAALLDQAGVTGEAQEAILRETASLRAEVRTVRAMQTLRDVAGDLGDPEDLPSPLAILIGIADAIGVGGRDGVSGESTARYPGLEALGKGRKQASDGPAWTEAIRQATYRMMDRIAPGGTWKITADSGEPGMLWITGKGPTGEAAWAVDPPLSPPWQLSLAREGLRRSLGLLGWHASARLSLPVEFDVEDATPGFVGRCGQRCDRSRSCSLRTHRPAAGGSLVSR